MTNQMIEIHLTQKQVDLLFPVLKTAESVYTYENNWTATKSIGKLYDELHKQIYTYGQAD